MFKSANLKGNLTIWNKQFRNLEEFNLLKEGVEEIGQQSKSLDSENYATFFRHVHRLRWY